MSSAVERHKNRVTALLPGIRAQIVVLAIFPLLILIAIVATATSIEHEALAAARRASHSDNVIEQSGAMASRLFAAELAAYRYAEQHDPLERARFSRLAAQTRADAAKLPVIVNDNHAQVARAERLRAAALRRLDVLVRVIALAHHGALDAAQRLFLSGIVTQAAGFRRALIDFQSAESALRARRRERLAERLGALQAARLIGVIGGSALTLALTLLIGLRIARRLDYVRRRAQRYERDRTILPPLTGSDEISAIDRALSSLALTVRRRESELARYRLLSETAQDAICFVHAITDVIVEANRAAAELFGYTREELIGMNAGLLRGNRPIITGEGTVYHSSGRAIPVEVRTAFSEFDETPLRISVVRNISDRKQNEATIAAALAQATEASRLKSEFVSTMSHEIRTPLNAVIGMSELLRGTDLTDEQLEYVDVLTTSGHALLHVINDILDFSKIEAGHLELVLEAFDLVATVESVGSLAAPLARKQRDALMMFIDPQIPRAIIGDAGRIRQILVNLVGNAVKFTHDGHVTLSADLREIDDRTVTVAFAVSDTGIGMSATQLGRVFEAFRQADGSATRRFGGTGLGLAISQRLANLMGSEIRVESEEGNGSRFHFDVTFHRCESAAASASGIAASTRVLVVDDDARVRNILSRYLVSWRIEHACAASADEALRALDEGAAQQRAFTIALIDLCLGEETDGLALGERIRARSEGAAPSLVMITALDSAQVARRSAEIGFAAYLHKPIRQSQLFDTIARLASEGAREESAPKESRPAEHAVSARILLAEDNEVNRFLALRQLHVLGYDNVLIARDGRDVLDCLERTHVDLILMDVHMPHIDGFRTTREIRRGETGGTRIPIIAMTANALAQDREDCLAAGMDDHIGKPVTLETLRRVLAQWLPARPAPTSRLVPTRVAAQETADAEILDRARLRSFFGDDQETMRHILASAHASLGALIERIASASDGERIELAHELKGTAGNIGAKELGARARAYESALKQHVSAAAEFMELRASYRRLTDAISREENAS